MVGDNNIGCDLAQETFFRAWSGLPGLSSPTFFTAWLYRIAGNCARDYQRHQRRLPLLPLHASTCSVAGPEESIEENELLQQALAQVSPIHRACLILYVIEDLSLREIAERLTIKETSVGKYISRGKEELRQVYLRLLRGQTSVAPKRRKGKVDE
jgi:RNA polymerase sigma-70 factor, ECF subfamily